MTTLKGTSNKLTVKFHPWLTWIFVGFVILGNLPTWTTILLQSIPKTLNCERVEVKQINCHIQNSTLPLLPSKKIVVKGLKVAKFKTKNYSNYRNPNQIPYEKQKILLLTQNREIKFLDYKIYSPEYTTPKILEWESQINVFINNPQQKYFKLKTGIIEPPWFVMNTPRWFLLGWIINSIFILIFTGEISICEFERSSGYMTKTQRWLFIFTKKTKYSLFDIQDVQLEWNLHRDNNYRITITLASGEVIPLSTYHTNYFKSEKNMEKTANIIRNFISLSRI